MPASLLPYLAFGGEFVLKLILVGVILLRGRGGRSTAALAWIVLILAVPIVGLLAYLLIGEVRLGRRRIARHRTIVSQVQASIPAKTADPQARNADVPAEFRPIATLGEAVGDNLPRGGNSLRLISDTDLFIQGLVEDIDAASQHCHLEFYIYLPDHSGTRVGEALIRAAARGVQCRLLVDAVGSKVFLRSPLRRTMEQGSVRVVNALPANVLRMAFARLDLRNHRKIAVIDGCIAYTGSQNIADAEFAVKRKFGPWVDTMVRIAGPAVRDLQRLFVEDWYLDTNEALNELLLIETPVADDAIAVQIMGTGPNSYNDALRQLTQAAFHTAREELILTTPYFVPDEATVIALRTAARRGVDTTLVLPARNDSPLVAAASRSFYHQLLEAGVNIFEFQKGLLHAKTMTIDRDLALVSTANLDRRSFDLNFEVSVVVYDTDFASQLRFVQRAYVADSKGVDASAWSRRPWPKVLVNNAVALVAPLL
ncbi:MAG: cardiolipin synthase [Phycisphaerales bacterium]